MSAPQSYLGSIKNRELVRDWLTDSVAAGVIIEKGAATYIDGNNGRKNTTGIHVAVDVRFTEIKFDNTLGTKGAKKAATIKSGAIICVKAKGAILVNSELQTAADGKLEALTTIGSTVGSVITWNQARVARYLGKPGELDEHDVDLTAAADGDEIFVYVY